MSGRSNRLWFVLATVVAAAGVAVSTASANKVLPSCGPTSEPFSQWGDNGAYCAFPNLGFENGATGWTLTGNASIVSDNEPWDVSGPGTQALQLAPAATAQSSPLPVNLLDPWIRFFAKSNGANGSLEVQVIFQGVLGNVTGVLNFGYLRTRDYSSWEPTPRMLSALALPLFTTSAEVLFTAQATAGSWEVDDVYLDPRLAKLG
jgi:hypothetical protein